jgi:hypothetical protein
MGVAAWILKQWPWVPEIEAGMRRTDPLLRSYVQESTTPKKRLAALLMRQCWGLSVQERQNQQGYLMSGYENSSLALSAHVVRASSLII